MFQSEPHVPRQPHGLAIACTADDSWHLVKGLRWSVIGHIGTAMLEEFLRRLTVERPLSVAVLEEDRHLLQKALGQMPLLSEKSLVRLGSESFQGDALGTNFIGTSHRHD